MGSCEIKSCVEANPALAERFKTVDWHEKDASIQKVGFIGFQLHNESKFEVRYRDISLIKIN
jgi:hypothetical protein